MTNATNPFGNKKIAVIKNGIVEDIVIVEPNDTTIAATLVELKQADFAVEVDDNDYQAKINGLYIDGEFWDIKDYPSWVPCQEHRTWEPPVSHPDDGKRYRWNEDVLNWVEVPPIE
jgi:hypothetical protein